MAFKPVDWVEDFGVVRGIPGSEIPGKTQFHRMSQDSPQECVEPQVLNPEEEEEEEVVLTSELLEQATFQAQVCNILQNQVQQSIFSLSPQKFWEVFQLPRLNDPSLKFGISIGLH